MILILNRRAGVEEVAEGAITVELQTKIISEFDDYMKNLSPATNHRNPWFKEYWEQLFSCQLPSSSPSSSQSSHSSSFSSSSTRLKNDKRLPSSLSSLGEEGEEESLATIREQLPVCPPDLAINESIGYSQETKVQFVVDAVYAFAEALHASWLDLCRNKDRVCKELKEMDGAEFYRKYLLKVNFSGELTHTFANRALLSVLL